MAISGYFFSTEGWAQNYTIYDSGLEINWTNPGRITGVSDYSYATSPLLITPQYSELIKARQFNFNIPNVNDSGILGGTITDIVLSGISATLYSYGSSGVLTPGYALDGAAFFCGTGVDLMNPASTFALSKDLIGKQGSPNIVWPTTSGGSRVFQYAGTLDLQNISIILNPTIANHQNFGFGIKALSSGAVTANIDAVYLSTSWYITEEYTASGGGVSGYTYFSSFGDTPTLFVRGFDYSSGSAPLFLQADESCSRTYGPKYGTGIYTTCAGGEFSWVTPSAVMVSDNIRATSDITTPNGVSCRLDVLDFRFDEIPDAFQVEGVKFSLEKKQNVGDFSIYDQSIYLVKSGIIQTYENKANPATWPESEATPIEYGGSTDLWGVPFLSAADIRASGFGVSIKAWSSGAVGTAYIDKVDCTIYGSVPCVHSGIPLYMWGFGPSGDLPLYMYSAAPESGGISLFINTVYSGSIPLYLQGNTQDSGNISLFLANHVESGGLPLYTAGIFGASGGSTLFLKADDWLTKQSGLSLSIPYSQTGNYSTNFFPLFIQARNHPQNIPLYIGVGNSAAVSGASTLYIKGGTYDITSVIPLYLSNSGTNNSLPLFIEGQKLTPYNPFFPSDGFYNWSGGVSLFIQRPIQEGLGLFIGSYLASGNMPFYVQGTVGSSGGMPLYMATSASGTSPMILYTNGY